MSPIRLVLLSTDLQKGGMPLRMVRLAIGLRTVDVEPIVGCLAPRGPLSDTLEQAGIETFSCDASGPLDFRCFTRFRRHIRRIDPDLIHSGLLHANLTARLLGRTGRRRPILTSTVTIEVERRWHRWLERLTSGLSDLHAANSQAVYRHLRDELGFRADRLVVVPNAIDLADIDVTLPADRAEFGIETDATLIVWAGRMDPVKRLDILVDVVAAVGRDAKIRALLLGDGPEREHIKTLIANRDLMETIVFAGWRDDVVPWLKAADVLLFPSRTEGSPNVVLEAMASGCCVVAADIPACAELITPGGSGYLCDPNDPDSFIRAVSLLSADRVARRKLADAARASVQEGRCMQDIVVRWRDVYDMLLSGSERDPG